MSDDIENRDDFESAYDYFDLDFIGECIDLVRDGEYDALGSTLIETGNVYEPSILLKFIDNFEVRDEIMKTEVPVDELPDQFDEETSVEDIGDVILVSFQSYLSDQDTPEFSEIEDVLDESYYIKDESSGE